MTDRIELRIRNLGKLEDFRVRVKDLMIFVGPNNTNKTWTAYIICAICSESTMLSYGVNFLFSRFSPWKEEVVNYLGRLKNGVEVIKDGSYFEFFSEEDVPFIKKLLRSYLRFVSKNFSSFLGSERGFERLSVSIYLYLRDKKKFVTEINNNLRKILLSYMELNDVINIGGEFLRWNGLHIIVRAIVYTLFGRVFNLPVERNAVVTFGNLISLGEGRIPKLINLYNEIKEIMPQLTRIKIGRQEVGGTISNLLQKFKEVDLDFGWKHKYRYPEPVAKFKEFIQEVPSLRPKTGKINQKLLPFLQRIMGGTIKASETGLYYEYSKNEILSLWFSSSMVKSLAGLYLYLAFRAEEGDFLVIDEPESNLHPEAQVKMIEFISIMVNKGIKVLMTTHSPYIVDHLVNLVEAATKKKKAKEIESKFFLETREAFIEKEKVSVYFFREDGKVVNILNEKTGIIDWETFSSISDRVAQLYYEI